ncbi:hypothetical protein BEH94_01285 [Candidatus Altiarchaeales archaeon WOR_SM1_SCG]|nr:hypothetical protein BEH94_01285 [Candidatus Altiarchaeales archaeon WOR_SM1_SCG]
MNKEEIFEGFIKTTEEKRAGDPITAGSAVIFPLLKIFIAFPGKELNCVYFSVTPYAIIAVDSKKEKIFSLSGEEIDLDYTIKEIPGLREKIRKFKASL